MSEPESKPTIVEQDKLIYGSTHDTNANNSEYVVSGEGEPLEQG